MTRAQKEMLEVMRDKGWFIRYWQGNCKYELCKPEGLGSGRKIKIIKPDWMRDLSPFFVETQNVDRKTTLYTLRPDATIDNDWLEAELQKVANA